MGKKYLIEKVDSHAENSLKPTLLNFQNGNLKIFEKEKVQYCTMVDKETDTKEALVAVEGSIYTGPVNGNESNELTDLYICVRNKETNKVRIMPIDQAELKNRIYVDIQKKQLESYNAKKPTDSALAKKKFIQEFSGSKAKRVMDSKEKMQVSLDVIKDDLEATIEQTTIAEEETEPEREKYIDMICPNINKLADNIEEIYDMNDLIPQYLLDKLEAEAQAIFNATTNVLPIKSAFLLERLEKFKQSAQSQTDILTKIKIIIFMDCLFNLITSKGRDLFKMELSGITAKVENYIRRSFALPGASMLVKLRKKALCYYIVLCMLISEERSVDTTMLAKELKLRLPEIVQHAHVVNALPTKANKECVALTLPRKVPPLKTAFKKKRRTI